jgi:hypothetical protein
MNTPRGDAHRIPEQNVKALSELLKRQRAEAKKEAREEGKVRREKYGNVANTSTCDEDGI